MSDIILASSSPYRKQLLTRILQGFRCISPDIDESPMPNEQPIELVSRLAQQKAMEIAKDHPKAIVIGSDQICVVANKILGKPGTKEAAVKQLTLCSAQSVYFYTSLSVIIGSTQPVESTVVATKVNFRRLTSLEIDNYINKENPIDCAGSFKCEGLGIALFTSIESKDPTALIGLPLITLSHKLRDLRVSII